MKKDKETNCPKTEAQNDIDLTDPEAARKAFIASEIFTRKY